MDTQQNPSKGDVQMVQIKGNPSKGEKQGTLEEAGETSGDSSLTTQHSQAGEWRELEVQLLDQTYIGEGIWEPTGSSSPEGEGDTIPVREDMAVEPQWIHKWRVTVDKDLALHEQVLRLGYPNRWGARIELEHKWNLQLFRDLLQGYEDTEVVEWIRYGWPTGRLPTMADPLHAAKNHSGATDHPQALQKYVDKEQSKGAIIGPYNRIPFTQQSTIGISPLSTQPKKDSEERRVVLDLSFPIGRAVNSGMIRDNYMGLAVKLTFPRIDELALRIFTIGKSCRLFKVDLSRYFRQLPLDPGDYSLIGYMINGQYYFDKVLPMGMRTAPYIAQRVTNAIAYIHRNM